MSTPNFTKDDLFILGHISARAVVAGYGKQALDVLQFIQRERPENAGGFLMQAVYMYSVGLVSEAIAFLDEASVFDAEISGDEAIAFYLVLLKADGQFDRAHDLGQMVLSEDTIQSESARHAIQQIMDELEAEATVSARSVLN